MNTLIKIAMFLFCCIMPVHLFSMNIQEEAQKNFESLLKTVNEGWGYSPSQDWQNKISEAAIKLIQLNNTSKKRSSIIDAINKAIDDYRQINKWYYKDQEIAAAKKNIAQKIYNSTVEGFKQFATYFQMIAHSPIDTNNTHDVTQNKPTIHWIYNPINGYFDLRQQTIKKVAKDAAALINKKIVPISIIEYIMNEEIQKAAQNAGLQLRSAKGLGIIKAIEKLVTQQIPTEKTKEMEVVQKEPEIKTEAPNITPITTGPTATEEQKEEQAKMIQQYEPLLEQIKQIGTIPAEDRNKATLWIEKIRAGSFEPEEIKNAQQFFADLENKIKEIKTEQQRLKQKREQEIIEQQKSLAEEPTNILFPELTVDVYTIPLTVENKK